MPRLNAPPLPMPPDHPFSAEKKITTLGLAQGGNSDAPSTTVLWKFSPYYFLNLARVKDCTSNSCFYKAVNYVLIFCISPSPVSFISTPLRRLRHFGKVSYIDTRRTDACGLSHGVDFRILGLGFHHLK